MHMTGPLAIFPDHVEVYEGTQGDPHEPPKEQKQSDWAWRGFLDSWSRTEHVLLRKIV